MQPDQHAERIMQTIVEWARAQPIIQAVAVVGSHARGAARADSDIDLVLLATDPQAFRADTAWLHAIDWNIVGARPIRWQDGIMDCFGRAGCGLKKAASKWNLASFPLRGRMSTHLIREHDA
jgi:hypothetical protein